jgi:GNAT superfamily N-acetyltransferase
MTAAPPGVRERLAVAARTDLAPAALVGAILDDFRASATRRRALPGERVIHSPALLAYACDVNSPDVNEIVRADFGEDAGDVDGAIEDAIRLFGGRSFLWWIGPGDRPGDLSDRLLAHDVEFLDAVPGMAMDLAELASSSAAPAPPELSVAPVLDLDDLAAFHTVVTHGFPEDWTDEAAIRAVTDGAARVATENAFREPHGVATRWLGRVDGRPVTTARVHTGAGVAGIYTVITIDAARRRGYGEAITRTALLAARDAGLAIATLQASDAGRRIYERIGFRELCRFRLHEWHPRRSASADAATPEDDRR